MLRPSQVAAQIGIPPRRVLALIRAGCLPAVDLSPNPKRPTYWVNPKELATFIEQRKTGPAGQMARAAPGRRATRQPSLEAIEFMKKSLAGRKAG